MMQTGPDGPDREERMRHANAAFLGAAPMLLAAQSVRSEVLVAAAAATGQVAVATCSRWGAAR